MRRSFQLGPIILACLAFACGKSASHEAGQQAGDGGSSAWGGAAGDPHDAGGTDAGSPSAGTGGRGGTSSAGDAGEGGSATEASSVALDGAPIFTRVQRLTNSQWEHAVTDILRLRAPGNLSQNLVLPVAGAAEFTNNEKLLYVDSAAAAEFELAAEAAAALATGSEDALAALDAGTDAEGFVQTLGRRAFRRPLTAEEQQKYEGVFALGETLYGAGFPNGAALVIRAMLQSPHFLYRSELGPAGEPLDGYEAASKLSFWLLGTTPNDALLDAAAAGDLDDADGLEATARAMLEQPGAVDVMRDFHRQLLRLDRLLSIGKAGVPEYTAELNLELFESSQLFFDRVFREDFGLPEIFSTNRGFVGPGLASLYGLATTAGGLEERELADGRLGYFMQIPFLLQNGINLEPNSIQRGLALHTDMLCAKLGLPDDELPAIPPLASGQTNRQRVTELTAGCGGECHTRIDPLGFAFENFDGMGQERERDNGQPIDTTGSFPFAEGVKEFAGAVELMQIMATSPQANTCYSKKVTGYALQRDIVESDRPLLEELAELSVTTSVKELMSSLVRHPAFRTRSEGTP